MIASVRAVLHVVCAVLVVGVACARAQTSEPTHNPPANAAPPDAAAAPSTAQRPRPQVNTTEITKRANDDVGVDIAATVAGWQRELDRIEGELRVARVRYSELNSLRDALQQVRGGVEDFADRLQPRLDAAKAQVDLLGPAPADGQPGEPEQIALNRAELNYLVGVLSGGRAAVNSAQLRIDQLINDVQDIRRRNFTSNLFQPVPGVYAPETWTRLPFFVPLATSRVEALVTDWWSNVRDHGEVTRIALGAVVLALVLMLMAWRGVPRLRRWHGDGEPPFWRRASSAAGVILLRILPAVAPIILLYVLVDQAQDLPSRIDRLFYAATQSAIIVFSVSALVATVFAPAAPQWRLVAASDRAARRICALVILLAVVYGLTTLANVATRIVQAPFALTIAVAVPACLLMAGIVIAIRFTPLEAKPQDGITSPQWLKLVRAAVWVAIAAVVASTLSGYVALSMFLTQQLVVTGSILALVYLLLLWVDGFTQGLGDRKSVV